MADETAMVKMIRKLDGQVQDLLARVKTLETRKPAPDAPAPSQDDDDNFGLW